MTIFVGYQVKGQFPKRHLPQGKVSDLALLENRIVQSSGTSVIRNPAITKTGWLKCQWCGVSPPPDDSPLLGSRGRIWETLTY